MEGIEQISLRILGVILALVIHDGMRRRLLSIKFGKIEMTGVESLVLARMDTVVSGSTDGVEIKFQLIRHIFIFQTDYVGYG